jgi:hypothetical protein
MGISIHYKGRLKTKKSLPFLIEEVKDIAETYKWKYDILEKEFPRGSFNKTGFDGKLYGICFSPPGSETVCLTFLSNGKLVNPGALQFFLDKKEMLEWSFVKTHYAGVTVHKIIIHLFDYLSKKYLAHFKMNDEAQYWETRDEKVAEVNFNKLNALMDSFASALETQPKKKGETFETYFRRLLEQINKRKTM